MILKKQAKPQHRNALKATPNIVFFKQKPKKINCNDIFFNAAAKGDVSLLRELYQKHGKKINASLVNKDNDFPLYIAAENGHVDTVKFLLEYIDNPANLNQLKNNGWSALGVAAFNGHIEVVKSLLAHIDKLSILNQITITEGTTPLFLATYNGHTEIVELLLKAGANPNIMEKGGCSPLDFAVQNGNSKLSTLLDGYEQNFHTALVQRMKILNFRAHKVGICQGFSETLKTMIFTQNETAINDCYGVMAWLKQIKASDLLKIQERHDNLIKDSEKFILERFHVSNEEKLSPLQHTQFQKFVNNILAFRRAQLTQEEHKQEDYYLYVCGLFNSIELQQRGYDKYLYLFPEHSLKYQSDNSCYEINRPLKGEILLTYVESGLKYKSLLSNGLLIEGHITLEEIKNEIGNAKNFEDFEIALKTNNSNKLNFYLENIIHIISTQEHMLSKRARITQLETPLWVKPMVQPQTLEQKGGEIQSLLAFINLMSL